MLRNVAVAFVTCILLSGCESPVTARYSILADNNVAIKGLGVGGIGVGSFTPPSTFDANCRAVGALQISDNLTHTQYIQKAFEDELKVAGAFAQASPRITLTGQIPRMEFSSTRALTGGSWAIDLVLTSSNARTFTEFLKLARARPGSLNYSAIGPGATQHFAGEMLKVAAKIDMTYVPFAGGAPAVLAVLGGHVSVGIATTQEVNTHVEAGKLRALAVTSRERDPAMKNVPTVSESGLPDYAVVIWWGLVAPAGTPADVVAKLNADTARVLKLPEISAKLLPQGLYPAPSTPAQFDAHIRSETARYAKIVKETGIRAD